jgi:hypothetical protein
MRSEFLPETEEEFREAVRYYEKEAPGVGLRFVAEVCRGVSFITENPFAAYPKVHLAHRRGDFRASLVNQTRRVRAEY